MKRWCFWLSNIEKPKREQNQIKTTQIWHIPNASFFRSSLSHFFYTCVQDSLCVFFGLSIFFLLLLLLSFCAMRFIWKETREREKAIQNKASHTHTNIHIIKVMIILKSKLQRNHLKPKEQSTTPAYAHSRTTMSGVRIRVSELQYEGKKTKKTKRKEKKTSKMIWQPSLYKSREMTASYGM